MKLKEIADQAINVIKTRGTEGINNAELAEIVGTPKRRVYDVIAILRAANLITTERDGAGTKIFWLEKDETYKEEVQPQTSFFTSKLKVSTDGQIYNVANRGSEVVIELDDEAKLSIEPILE